MIRPTPLPAFQALPRRSHNRGVAVLTIAVIRKSFSPPPGPKGAPPPARTRDSGLRHPAVITGEFDADFAKLKDAGAEALSEPEIRGGNRVVFFRDPDGNVLHLAQRPTPLVLA